MSAAVTARSPLGTLAFLVALAALVAAACTPSDPRVTIVDGWSIGSAYDCGAAQLGGAGCEELLHIATAGLALREPGHAAIARTSMHAEGKYPCKRGGGISEIIRSGGGGYVGPIVLFELVDGSRRAVMVFFELHGGGVTHPEARDHGPEVAPWECTDGPHPPPHPTEVAGHTSVG